jgi:hypothetical protein
VSTGSLRIANDFRRSLKNSIGIVTALNPYIGYTNATQVAQQALASGRSVADIVIERGLLTRAQLDEILQPAMLTQPRKALVFECEKGPSGDRSKADKRRSNARAANKRTLVGRPAAQTKISVTGANPWTPPT